MTRNRFFASTVGLTMLFSSAFAFSQEKKAQADNKPEYILKVYRVSDLFTPRPDYPYRSGIPTTGTVNQSSSSGTGGETGGMSGGIGGGGMGSGGGMGGGGIFQVPDPIPRVAQMGGEGGFGGGGGGLGGVAGMGFDSGPGIDETLRFNRDELRDAITYSVLPDTWSDAGGEGVLTPLGGLFLIKQTAEAHKLIEQLLNDIRTEGGSLHTVTLDATWLSLTAEEFEKLAPKQNGEGGELAAIDPALFKELAAKNTTHQGRVSCYNDQTVHLVSGDRRTLVVGAIPTVGFGSVGYTLQLAVPNVGLLLQVRPTVDPNRESAVLNVSSTITEWQDPGEAITIKTDFEPASKEGIPTKGGSTQISLDRVNLKSQHLGTTVRVPIGQPVLVGGMSELKNDPKSADAPARQLYLIVKLTLNEAA